MKITAKLIITIIIVSLLTMLCFELAYNRIVYKNYTELYNTMIKQEERLDRLYEVVLKFMNMYFEEERKDGVW